MASPSISNPLSCLASRQIDDRFDYAKRLVRARFDLSENLFRKDLISHYGCVNAIEFSKEGDLLVSGGDDRRVLLWRVEQAIKSVGKPAVMRAQHASNIFCLGYDSTKTKIFSAGNDDQVIVHDLQTGGPLNFFLHEKPVYGLSVHPDNYNTFASACDDGRVLIYDIRDSPAAEPFCLAQYKSAFHSVMFNPVDPTSLATANAKEGVSKWDVRNPLKPVLRYGSLGSAQSCMNVRYNATGTQLLALRRRLPPVLYDVDSASHLCQFDHPGYYNSCTMKSCCFAGDNDQYILSGSDDFNLYMWKIPSEDTTWVDSAHMILHGHRSIVNQVRYNESSCILASAGVEKIIKIWSPFTLGDGCLGGLKRDAGKQERQRRVFTHEEYISLVLHSGEFMTHDYSNQSTLEDPRMMAFFDSLVQREIEGRNSEDAAPESQIQSDSDNNDALDLGDNASDSDDSTVLDRQLMLSILGAARNLRTGPPSKVSTSERLSETPNRITEMIINRRHRLWQLGVVGRNSSSKTSAESSSRERQDDTVTATTSRKVDSNSNCKSKVRSKGMSRKQSKTTSKKCRSRRKYYLTMADTCSDSEKLDAAQPSTSSGIVSRSSSFAADSMRSRKRFISSSDEEVVVAKPKTDKNDSDSSVSRGRQTKTRRLGKGKHSGRRTKNARVRIEYDMEEEVVAKEPEARENNPAETPSSEVSKSPLSPDSGITSGISTVEKSGEELRSAWNGGENSDHEVQKKYLERFRKKVDVARRGYRKRSASLIQVPSSTTDSSE